MFPNLVNLRKILNSNNLDKNMHNMFKATKVFTNNPQLFFTHADKGNAVVAMNEVQYLKSMVLSDTDTYTLVKCNPDTKMLVNLKSLLKRWKQ